MLEKNNHSEQEKISKQHRNRKWDAMGCGLFFIWIGIAVLTDLGWGIALIGIGLIIIGLRYLSPTGPSRTSKAPY